MGENSKIEWTDHTFSPWWGCTKVSAACTNCYAEDTANFRRPGAGLWRGNRHRMAESTWRNPLAWNRKAAKEGRNALVFCASMADVFEDHPALPPWREDLWDLIERTPRLVWLLLTKRPENVERMVPLRWWQQAWPANVWVGTTVEDQQRADERIPHLLRVPAPVRFLSCEPLLGPVDLSAWLGGYVNGNQVCCGHPSDGAEGPECCGCPDPEEPGVRWVITGSESGPRRRPTDLRWVRDLRDQCASAGVPFFAKQLDLGAGLVHAPVLDGRQWLEVPCAP